MAARKKAPVARAITGYVFADEDGKGPSDVWSDIDVATDEAKVWLEGGTHYETQVVFALVPMRRVAQGGSVVTTITE